MGYILASLSAALLLSMSDLCANYALDNGSSNLTHTFWSHGVVYLIAIIISISIISCAWVVITDNADNAVKVIRK